MIFGGYPEKIGLRAFSLSISARFSPLPFYASVKDFPRPFEDLPNKSADKVSMPADFSR